MAKEKLRVHRGLRVGVEHKWFPHCELRYPRPEKTRGRTQNGSVMMFFVGDSLSKEVNSYSLGRTAVQEVLGTLNAVKLQAEI